eukprot:PLAT6536.1.p1 GENE.PLAT6536.1~~PLAT6536.1.p1  ORF type:complete len:915 (-),score=235.65 PLAT6536.1:1148-3892(-)
MDCSAAGARQLSLTNLTVKELSKCAAGCAAIPPLPPDILARNNQRMDGAVDLPPSGSASASAASIASHLSALSGDGPPDAPADGWWGALGLSAGATTELVQVSKLQSLLDVLARTVFMQERKLEALQSQLRGKLSKEDYAAEREEVGKAMSHALVTRLERLEARVLAAEATSRASLTEVLRKVDAKAQIWQRSMQHEVDTVRVEMGDVRERVKDVSAAAVSKEELVTKLLPIRRRLETVEQETAAKAPANLVTFLQEQMKTRVQRTELEQHLREAEEARSELDSGLRSRVAELERMLRDELRLTARVIRVDVAKDAEKDKEEMVELMARAGAREDRMTEELRELQTAVNDRATTEQLEKLQAYTDLLVTREEMNDEQEQVAKRLHEGGARDDKLQRDLLSLQTVLQAVKKELLTKAPKGDTYNLSLRVAAMVHRDELRGAEAKLHKLLRSVEERMATLKDGVDGNKARLEETSQSTMADQVKEALRAMTKKVDHDELDDGLAAKADKRDLDELRESSSVVKNALPQMHAYMSDLRNTLAVALQRMEALEGRQRSSRRRKARAGLLGGLRLSVPQSLSRKDSTASATSSIASIDSNTSRRKLSVHVASADSKATEPVPTSAAPAASAVPIDAAAAAALAADEDDGGQPPLALPSPAIIRGWEEWIAAGGVPLSGLPPTVVASSRAHATPAGSVIADDGSVAAPPLAGEAARVSAGVPASAAAAATPMPASSRPPARAMSPVSRSRFAVGSARTWRGERPDSSLAGRAAPLAPEQLSYYGAEVLPSRPATSAGVARGRSPRGRAYVQAGSPAGTAPPLPTLMPEPSPATIPSAARVHYRCLTCDHVMTTPGRPASAAAGRSGFRTEMERRRWQLDEKRRALVEQRLGRRQRSATPTGRRSPTARSPSPGPEVAYHC